MANAHDVASCILEKLGPTTAMKLQKLLYYCQAWSLVWDDRPLFDDRIEAWANGPVLPSVYECHRGEFLIRRWPGGSSAALDPVAVETIEAVLGHYGSMSSQELVALTHAEAPWREARAHLGEGVRGNAEISHASMAEYYGAL